MLRLASQTLNGVAGNDPGLTVCGALYVGSLLGCRFSRVGVRIINNTFFFHQCHCLQSWEKTKGESSTP